MADDDAPAASGGAPRNFVLQYFASARGAVAAVRALVLDALAGWGVPEERRADAALVVTELVNNAVVHSAAQDAEVELQDAGDTVFVVVECNGSPPPARIVPAEAGGSATSGRGLTVVDAFAARWGIEDTGYGVRAWCEVPAPAAERLAPASDVAEVPVGPAVLRAFNARSQVLLRLTEALTVAQGREDVAGAVTRVLGPRLGARFVGIVDVGVDGGGAHYVGDVAGGPGPTATRGPFRLDRTDSPVLAAARDGRARFLETRLAALTTSPALARDLADAGIGATAALPLVVEGRTIGVLLLGWPSGRVIDADERALLRTVAGYAAAALSRAQVVARRLELATSLQRALLPHELPRDTPVRLAADYLPESTVAAAGGDWYDALTLPDGRLILSVGDVAGHGVEASTVMASLRHTVRAHAVLGAAPAEVLRGADALVRATRPGTVAAVLLGRYDPRERSLVLASAGHLPPLLVHADQRAEYLDVEGVVLGADPSSDPAERRVDVPADAALVLFTDGLVTLDDGDVGAALERIAEVATRQWSAAHSPRRLVDKLLAVRRASGPLRDDVCVLVASHPA